MKMGKTAGLLALLLGGADLGWCAEPVGFVVDVTGDWFVPGSAERLRVGETVGAGASVSARAPQKGWRVAIALADGSSAQKMCATVEACSEPLQLPPAIGAKASFWERAVRAAGALVGHAPDRYASTMSRGVAASDGVAGLVDGRLEMGEIVGELPAGRYAIELRALGDLATGVVRLEYGGEPRIASPGVRTGLYEATVIPASSPDEASTAWVLVVGEGELQAARDAFGGARAAAASWESARPRAVRSYLRAYLEVLAGGAK